MNGYDLNRNWFNFCFENPHKIKPAHHAIYHFAIERCNRLGWKENFNFPTDCAMETIGIKNYKTYIKALNEVASMGFIKIISRSKNQYTSNTIALVENAKATTGALDKALQMQGESSVSINKQLNIKHLNKKPLSEIPISDVPEDLIIYYKHAIAFQKLFIKNLEEKNAPSGAQERAAFDSYITPIRLMIEKDGVTNSQLEEALKFLGSPQGNFWKQNILSTKKLREKISQLLIQKGPNSTTISEMDQAVLNKFKSFE